MQYISENPLIVQSDMSMLLEVNSPLYEEVRDAIVPFSEIVKTPEHVHTYRISAISLWNSASAGLNPDQVIERLNKYSRYEISHNLIIGIRELMGRYGRVKIENYDKENFQLSTDNQVLLELFLHTDSVSPYLGELISPCSCLLQPLYRGVVKQALIKIGYPAIDIAGYTQGESLEININEEVFSPRSYQIMARDSFYKGGTVLGGNGVIVLPCGAGKTIVGMLTMSLIKTHTIILTTGITAIRQWKRELLEKTFLTENLIGEYSGELKEIRPITISTYQILTHRKKTDNEFIHFQLLNNHPWGLIIYDEVHLLPAQMFRFSASLQGVRRLGLTATLVREDGREDDVFSLIGPKSFDIPWRVIEKQGWIAQAKCFEIRVPIASEEQFTYATADKKMRFRIASETSSKIPVIKYLLSQHKNELILIIGQYIAQVTKIAQEMKIPIITGSTSQKRREELYSKFKNGEITVLVVSSVANFAIDLPDASVAIQVSGKFGSRQEEAQRLGRILRPKSKRNQAMFYSLVTLETEEQDFALNRQLFLTEQGYEYNILTTEELISYK